MTIPDEAVQAAHDAFNKTINDPSMVPCSRCSGKGYHHGFGEDGASPDWCIECGGSAFDVVPGEEERAMRAALTAALPFLTGVKVKALEWHKSHMSAWNGDYHTVPTAYTVRLADENGWKWQGFGGHGYENSPEASKAAAQADYEARIRSAIEIAPSPRAQALEELPCDVQLPGVILKRGVKFSVLLSALKRRDSWPDAARALSSQPVADGWLPMDHPDLPDDGTTVILATTGGHVGEAVPPDTQDEDDDWYWCGAACRINKNHKPIAWRPLPASPGVSE